MPIVYAMVGHAALLSSGSAFLMLILAARLVGVVGAGLVRGRRLCLFGSLLAPGLGTLLGLSLGRHDEVQGQAPLFFTIDRSASTALLGAVSTGQETAARTAAAARANEN